MFPSPVESNQRPAVRLFNDLNLPFFAWHAPLPAPWIPHWKLPKSRYFSEKTSSRTIRVTLPPYSPLPSATGLTRRPGILGIRKNGPINAGFIG